MPNARIQFSAANEEEWEKINPKLREGEMAVIKKKTGRYMLKMGDIGGSTYKDSVLVWDQDDAETKIETATTMAEKAKASQDASAVSAANAKLSEEKAAESEEKSTENADKVEAIAIRLAQGQLAADWVERLNKKADKGTTLADYGITDARIEGEQLKLGRVTITPVTENPDGTTKIKGCMYITSNDTAPDKVNSINDFFSRYSRPGPRIGANERGDIIMGSTINSQVMIKDDLTVGGNISASKVYNAVYNDYAEWFERGDDATEGHIIALDETSEKEQYIKATDKSRAVVGICTNNYAHIIGGESHEDYEAYNLKKFIPVSLAGRVPVYVKGKVGIGDSIVPSEVPGIGKAIKGNVNIGKTVGMALQKSDDEGIKLIKVLVRR